MITTTHEKREPYISSTAAEALSQISAHVKKGCFHFTLLNSPDDTDSFDRDMIEWVGKIKSIAQGAGMSVQLEYLRYCKPALVLSNDAYFLTPLHRQDDIRKTPIDFCGYRVSYIESKARGVYDITFSISPDLLDIHKWTFPRGATLQSVTEAGADLQKLLKVRTPEILEQVESVYRAVNEARRAAGLEIVPRTEAGLDDAPILPMRPTDK